MVPSTLEWHLAALAFVLLGIGWGSLALFGGVMLLVSVVVAALQAAQAKLRPEHDSLLSRLLIGALCWAQPLVRSWVRYRTRYFGHRAPVDSSAAAAVAPARTRLARGAAAYWGEDQPERTDLLDRIVTHLVTHGCGKTIDTGWSDADLEVFHDPWKIVKICTVQEEHGCGKRLIRVRYRQRLGGLTKAFALLGIVAAAVSLDISPSVGLACLAAVAVGLAAARWSGGRLLRRLANIVDELALEMGLCHCDAQLDVAPQRCDEACSAITELETN
jgi:hypothetical protein